MINNPVTFINSIRFRLIASVVLIEIVMLSILVWNNISIIHSTHTDRLRDTANSMIQQIANSSGQYLLSVDYASLKQYLNNNIHYNEVSYIIIVDRVDSAIISLGDIEDDSRPKTDKHPNDVNDGIYDISHEIKIANQPMGRVLMGFSLSQMEQAINKSRTYGITIASIEIALTIIVTIFIGLGLTKRITTLSLAAAEVEAGNYSISVSTDSNDEIGKTATAFNKMIRRISQETQQLKIEKDRTKQLLLENRLLIRKSLDVQDEERKNLARELHNELKHSTTAINSDAETIKQLSPDNNNRIHEKAEAISQASAHINDVVHSMINLLRPAILDNLGLEKALTQEIQDWNQHHVKIVCLQEFSGDLSNFNERINITIYRIVQECLTNIVQHSHAKNVKITLSNNDGKIRLTISDDGIGMDTKKPKTKIGIGLIGMRERIQSLDGTFGYETSLEGGFCVLIYIPPHSNIG